MEIRGARVLVTGASRGIGAAIAQGFASAGADVALVARSPDSLGEVAERTGGTAYPADLGDLDAIPDLVEKIEADGAIDVLVNNAAVEHVGWFADRTWEEVAQVIDVNLKSPVRLAHLFVPRMLERGRGRIVNISSMAAVMSPPGLAAYTASKAGLSGFTAALRMDLRDTPIGATIVHLGSVRGTEMDERARSYGPLRKAAEQSQGRDLVALDKVVAGVVGAVANDRDVVNLPRLLAGMPAITELPRALTRLVFRRFPAHEERSDA